jgi:hypothetical protein
VAAHEVMKALRVGGLLFLQTHQSFVPCLPVRLLALSREALAGLFGTQSGLHVFATDYDFTVKLYSPAEAAITTMPSYFNIGVREKVSFDTEPIHL